jgi:anti-anti-sigma factor
VWGAEARGPLVQIECHDRGDGDVEVVLSGHFDISGVDDLRKALLVEVLGTRPRAVVLDLSGVGFIDSSILGVLVAARKRAVALEIDLLLRAPSERVRHILEATGLARVFPEA